MSRLAVHEAGHVVAARHFGASGHEVAFYADGSATTEGWFAQVPDARDRAVIALAGVAAEAMLCGAIGDGYQDDLAIVHSLLPDVSEAVLNVLQAEAGLLLVGRRDELVAVAGRLEGLR